MCLKNGKNELVWPIVFFHLLVEIIRFYYDIDKLQQRCSSGRFIKYRNQVNCLHYVSNLPFVTESNFKGGHPLINDVSPNCPYLLSISLV